LDEAVKKVTVADVKRVANLYLNMDQSTTGWFIPLLPGAPKPASHPTK
jgi:zinc protease